MSYLTHNNDEAYVGLLPLTYPQWAFAGTMTPCPKCRGYGHWILVAKPGGHSHRQECFRSKCQGPHHFMSSCNQCDGSGYVRIGSKNESCVHDYRHAANTGKCLNRYECSKCGQSREVDSSD